ncbi:MAG: gamma-glutamyltransferase family protein [Polaromonas sp.]|uniref:gamma-glutamyltransferase family protein n=3 Tax=Polaromonas sp. TaxID=1869339 RepID=UPI00272FE9A4|nr:gamma-glutamyltransferase family protein [Polaromonas sp.]MDP2448460.1 gamma-glutamyltransferase family protein [Polaromonas sp.]MDP3249345.1 gamma-glutamyltransferase family protein [Polaromonas sp.]
MKSIAPAFSSKRPAVLSPLSGLALAAALLVAGCATAPPFAYSVPAQPEGASGYTEKPGWANTSFAVAAANPLATDAGYQVLKAGGTAIDAAIAVQMVLTLVEPQSSGIGGGAFLLHASGSKVEAFDGRETAPAAADEKLFVGADGKPMTFIDGVVGGRSVGVPGTVRMLEMAHKQHGKLPWAQLFVPAITLAEGGFKVSARLATLLKTEQHLKKDPVAAAYFYQPNGEPLAAGSLLRNQPLADVLKKIAAGGSKALLEGDVAEAIVTKVRSHPINPGQLSLADLAGYQAKKREPICHDYRAQARDYRICGMPPPSSGAIAVGQILGILNNTPAATLALDTGMGGTAGAAPSADWLHLYTEASRLAFADRAQYLADPDFVQPPGGSWMSLLDPAYLADRARLIAAQPGGQSMKVAKPGTPGGVKSAYAPMPEQPEYGTSHISIVDAYGNAIAMTTTIEDAFGARQMVGGFLLNNELTDFSFAPTDASGAPVANRVQPGKRPRSSMAPTLVFDKATGQLVMSGGSPGGALIIHYTAKTLYGVLNWGQMPQQAINLPNFGSLNGPTLLEEKRFAPATVEALKARGHEVREMAMTSGLQAITRGQAHGKPLWLGGADPRREGVVMGD